MHRNRAKKLKCSPKRQSIYEGVETDIFKDTAIYIIPAALGKIRLNVFKTQILRHGGQLLDTFKDTIEQPTLIVADESLTREQLQQIVGLAADDRRATKCQATFVKTSWVSECLRQKQKVDVRPYLFDTRDTAEPFHCATKEQANITSNCQNGGDNIRTSVDSAEGRVLARPRINPVAKFVCSAPSTSQQINHNLHITEMLEALADTYKATKDRWRAMGYERAISALKRHHKEIVTWEEARSLPAVGDRLADKVWEIIESGRLRKMEEVCSSEKVAALKLFSDVWGIGPTTAQSLVQQGHRTLEDLKAANLNRQQAIGLRHYRDFLDRMSREEAAEIEATVRNACLQLDPSLEIVACGSYRRNKSNCGDVDVLVTHPDGESHRGLLPRILTSLRQTGFLTDDLVAHEQNGDQHKYLGVCKLPKSDSLHRRLDIIVVPYSEFACSLLYFTGSAHFNRSMRLLARKMGMSLSEHSLNEGVIRKGQERLCEGNPLSTPTEQSVFEHLGLAYRPPEERDY